MKYLLDTHIVLESLLWPDKLSQNVTGILEAPVNKILVSAVTFWEVSVKFASGKLSLEATDPAGLLSAAVTTGYEIVSLEAHTAAHLFKLPGSHHKDPFDRMLIWLALNNDWTLVSNDKEVKKYAADGLRVVW